MCKRFGICLVATALVFAGSRGLATAGPILVSDTELILNWDFSGETPGPPFDIVRVDLTAGLLYQPDSLSVWLYPELDGLGTPIASVGPIVFSAPSGTYITIQFEDVLGGNADFLDGVFSAGLLWHDDNPASPGPEVLGYAFAGGSARIEGTVSDTSVPEPASLLLLGTGLVGVMAQVRRRR